MIVSISTLCPPSLMLGSLSLLRGAERCMPLMKRSAEEPESRGPLLLLLLCMSGPDWASLEALQQQHNE